MTKDQLEELKTEVTSTVHVVVNGKIIAMSEKFDAYIADDMKWKADVETYMTEMRPLKEGVQALQAMNKFVKWLGLPALGALIAYWIAK